MTNLFDFTRSIHEDYLSKILPSLRFWDRQRMILDDHLDQLLQSKRLEIRTKGFPTFFQVITLCRYNGELYIVDGQHRILCAKRLCEEKLIKDVKFWLEIIDVKSESDIMAIFQEINKSVPVPIHYTRKNDVVDAAYARLETTFNGQFSNHGKSNRPKVDRDAFTDILTKINEHYNFASSDELFSLIVETDNLLKKTYQQNPLHFLTGVSQQEIYTRKNVIDKCFSYRLSMYGMLKEKEFGSWLD